MGLTRDWGRQLARAAGVSLIAPLALLGAIVVVAAGGGGLGGLGSLTQIASGPSLPPTDLIAAPRTSSLGRAQVVSLGRSAAPAGARTGRSPSASAPGPSTPSGGDSPGREVAQNPNGPPASSVGPGPSPVPGSPGPSGPAPQPPAATPAPSAPTPPAGPVGGALGPVRDLGESLPAPVGPTVGGTLDSTLGPRP